MKRNSHGHGHGYDTKLINIALDCSGNSIILIFLSIESNIKLKSSIPKVYNKRNSIMMEFPKMGEDWISRFMDFLAKKQYKAFREDYVAKVQTEFAVQLNCRQELKKRKTIAVTNYKQLFTEASANVVANGTSVEQFAHLKTTFAQLAKSEADEREAEDRLESLQFEKDEKVSGTKDPENIEWIRNLEVINKSNEASKAAFIAELDKQLDSMPTNWWDEVTNGSNRKSK